MIGHLSEHDHELMDRYLEALFDTVEAGQLIRYDFVERMALLMTALDVGAHDEVRYCFEHWAQGRGRAHLQDDAHRASVARAA